MTALKWRIQIAQKDGPTVLMGKTELPEKTGELHLVPSLPEGTIESVSAVLPLELEKGERVFLNGYQTWTHCPEYGPKDRLRGLNGIPRPSVKSFGMESYGDYGFVDYPNRPGLTHGFSYCSFRQGKRFRLFASLDERPGYTIFKYDAKKAELRIERDCAGLKCGGDFHAFDLYYAEGTEDEVYDGWFKALGLPAPTAEPIKGYSSWYNLYEKITEDSIRRDLDGCRTLLQPGDLFQIDDGWESAVGDWLEPNKKKFPGGMKKLAEEIHAAGFKAGLWLAPFGCRKGSRLHKEHPDWLLKDDKGKPWLAGCNWGGFYALDIDLPEVREYLRRVFDRVLYEWGFDFVKLDFLYAAAPFGNERESRAGRMIRALELLRGFCTGKLILGCGVPVMPAFGLVDYCRISCDVGLDWDNTRWKQLFIREGISTKQAIENTIYRRPLNGRAYLSDPDVFYLRKENIKLTEEEKLLLARVNALLGGVLLTSDDPGTYGDEQRETYREILRLFQAKDVYVDPDILRIHYTLDGEARSLQLPAARLN